MKQEDREFEGNMGYTLLGVIVHACNPSMQKAEKVVHDLVLSSLAWWYTLNVAHTQKRT
jgi:hypothetical protein